MSNAVTVGTSPITVTIRPGVRADALTLWGVVADSVRLVVRDSPGGNVVFDSGTVSLSTRIVRRWYEWLTVPFTFRSRQLWLGLPPITTAEYEVTFTRASGLCECAALMLGQARQYGHVQWGFENQALSFGAATRDRFGNATLVPGEIVPVLRGTLEVDVTDLPAVYKLRDELANQVTVWLGIDDSSSPLFEVLSIVGFFKDLPIRGATAKLDYVGLDIEGIM
jgi:hypothetical protein